MHSHVHTCKDAHTRVRTQTGRIGGRVGARTARTAEEVEASQITQEVASADVLEEVYDWWYSERYPKGKTVLGKVHEAFGFMRAKCSKSATKARARCGVLPRLSSGGTGRSIRNFVVRMAAAHLGTGGSDRSPVLCVRHGP